MRVLDLLRTNLGYAFLVAGVVWLAVVYITEAPLNLWPVVAFFIGGALLKFRPGERLTWAWSVSSTTMGLLLAGYQAYSWIPFLAGSVSTLAVISLVGFTAFAIVHLLLLYSGRAAPTKSASRS